MKTQWSKIAQDPSGDIRYKRNHPKASATIHRQPDSLSAEMKTGLFGLGSHVGVCFMDTQLSDEVVLSRLDEVANPPRFEDWKEVKGKSTETNETHYQGRESGGLIRSKVKASIRRQGEQAEVSAQVGLFGTQIEGIYFAPAPSDQEILRRISQSST